MTFATFDQRRLKAALAILATFFLAPHTINTITIVPINTVSHIPECAHVSRRLVNSVVTTFESRGIFDV